MADNKKEQERAELHRVIWGIANDLRGSVDGWDFKQYVLGMLFYRYISENLTNYINEGEHGTTYVLSRWAGFSPEEARVIAYASQYVDDAVYSGRILFNNGAKYFRRASAHELENLLGCRLLTTEEVLAAADKLRDSYKIENVVVSLGSEGALFVGQQVLLAEGIKVQVKSTVGAGDAMVGALAFALDQGYSFERAAILAVAAGTAAVTMDGTQASDLGLIRSYAEQVKWKEIKREK